MSIDVTLIKSGGKVVVKSDYIVKVFLSLAHIRLQDVEEIIPLLLHIRGLGRGYGMGRFRMSSIFGMHFDRCTLYFVLSTYHSRAFKVFIYRQDGVIDAFQKVV